jgi:alpha-galactosidase
MRVARSRSAAGSWCHYGLFVSADDVLANASWRSLPPRQPGFDLVQIDDRWQVTYGAWWPNERCHLGVIGELRSIGCAGLWLAPFMVQPGAPGVGTVHPDWCVRDAGGAPAVDRFGRWGLDASNPAVVEWLRDLAEQVRSWGFDMVKLDFLYLGALEGRRHDARQTGVEALRTGLRAFVDALGDHVYVLGCGLPVLPAVGICHGNRVGHDLAMPRALQDVGQPVDDDWTGFAERERNVRRWAHRRWYEADPEVVAAWPDGADPPVRPRSRARDHGGRPRRSVPPRRRPAGSSDWRRAERDCSTCSARRAPTVDIFDAPDDAELPEHAYVRSQGVPARWTTTHDGRVLTALFNWGDEPTRAPLPAELVGAREIWTGESVGDSIDLPARSARLLVTSAG